MNFHFLSTITLLLTLKNKTAVGDSEIAVVEDHKEFSYQVSIRAKEKHICSGALISYRYVLTAAHCFFVGKSCITEAKALTVVAGTNLLEFNCKTSIKRVQHLTLNHDFALIWHENNVALLRLQRSYPSVSEYIQPINLPTEAMELGKQAVLSGWNFDEELPAGKLQHLTVDIMTKEKCDEVAGINTEGLFCSSPHVCKVTMEMGDLGAPLICGDTLCGISMYRNCGMFEGFVDVFHYKPWILSITRADATWHKSIGTLVFFCVVFVVR